MKVNCLTRGLDQWNSDPEVFRLWYNSNHVISLESHLDGSVLKDGTTSYLPLTDYGLRCIELEFKDLLTPKYKRLLISYFNLLNEGI